VDIIASVGTVEIAVCQDRGGRGRLQVRCGKVGEIVGAIVDIETAASGRGIRDIDRLEKLYAQEAVRAHPEAASAVPRDIRRGLLRRLPCGEPPPGLLRKAGGTRGGFGPAPSGADDTIRAVTWSTGSNPLAPWVLRIGRLRVYSEVAERPDPCVTIRAIGVKVRERVLVGGVEIDLS